MLDIVFVLFFVYRSLGQEVFRSVQEADYEIASYARHHGCMGILGQDSDFIIYDRSLKIIMLIYLYFALKLSNYRVLPKFNSLTL